jgi:hypothetical protein
MAVGSIGSAKQQGSDDRNDSTWLSNELVPFTEFIGTYLKREENHLFHDHRKSNCGLWNKTASAIAKIERLCGGGKKEEAGQVVPPPLSPFGDVRPA